MTFTPNMFSSWWQALKTKEKNALKITLAVLGFLSVFVTWFWMREEQRTMQGTVSVAAHQLAQMQNDISEVRRLKRQKPLDHLSTETFLKIIETTQYNHNLKMTIIPLGDDRWRVEGYADFDQAMSWIGQIQNEYAICPISLSIIKQAQKTKIVAVLSYAK